MLDWRLRRETLSGEAETSPCVDPVRARLLSMHRGFQQVDVFGKTPYGGNPVAVVLDGSGMSTEDMQHFANWTNLSETTFVLPPTTDQADYRVRIFTSTLELPFAGHPTLGTCHAWLAAGGTPRHHDRFVQECAAGLIPLRRIDGRLAFAAPPLVRSGPVEDSLLERIAGLLQIQRADIIDASWANNGPPWIAVMLGDAQAALDLRPSFGDDCDLDIGIVGFHPEGSECQIEVRAFFHGAGVMTEDPVTGSLNAGLAQWLVGSGKIGSSYVAAQGTALGRTGRIHVTQDDEGIWIAGNTVTCIAGTVGL
jgi:PhzF family phenazine biosynthesis protein